MPKVTLTLNDELFQEFARYAAQEGMEVDEFLSRAVQQNADRLLPKEPKEWMPLEQWDALVRGDQCPLCVEIASLAPVNSSGSTVADLGMSRLRLASNQYVPGYCILICTKHVKELYHLTLEERTSYIEDLMHSAKAIEAVFEPLKMNFQILGNAVPHLHCHIIPRYYGDAAPGSPLYPNSETRLLASEIYEERVNLLRAAL